MLTQRSSTLETLGQNCAAHGFTLLGVLDATDPQDGSDCQIVLIGNVGDEFWEHFARSPEYHNQTPEPLDHYCHRVLHAYTPTAARLIMPTTRPYAPFQHWAQQSGVMHPSPLGLLIHREYGLWFAFRAAWRFPAGQFTLHSPKPTPSPCARCTTKPCLSSCPVAAFDASGFDAKVCREYLASSPNPCTKQQCQARLACPVGTEYRYGSNAGQFFLKAFAST